MFALFVSLLCLAMVFGVVFFAALAGVSAKIAKLMFFAALMVFLLSLFAGQHRPRV